MDDFRASGIAFVAVLVLTLAIAIGVLDAINWNHEFRQSVLAEANAVVIDLFLLGTVIAVYDFRRKRRDSVKDIEAELERIRTWSEPDGIFRKVQLIHKLNALGAKPRDLRHFNLQGASLNGLDLSEVNMRFLVADGAFMVHTDFARAQLTNADFRRSTLVEADMSDANLTEAHFEGAQLAGVAFTGANVANADFRGAHGLTREQLTSARNWPQSRRDTKLACGEPIPDGDEKSLGQQFREMYRGVGNPCFPYVLTRVIQDDGSETVIALLDDGS